MIGFEDMALYVCQSEDDDYYASHRFDGNEDAAGMIYLDFQCSLWPASDNMVLYGHNMRVRDLASSCDILIWNI